MSNKVGITCKHVLELQPGDEGEIELLLAADEGATFAVGLAAVDPAASTAELVLEDMWNSYQMRQYSNNDERWKAIWPGDDGEVHAVVSFGAGKHLNISSDLAQIHSLDLTEVMWQGDSLRLTFREGA
jgi:hypothetical protein